MSPSIVTISTDFAPAPAGHYSQGVVAGGHLYVSGQLPIRADGSPCLGEDFEAQATQAIANMLAILKAAGGGPQHLVKVTAYIVGVANWPRFNAVYAGLLGDARPARTVVPVTDLHHGFLVEIDAVAVVPG
ncbi:RidA family protein [Bosea sp. PAMC 26642]|uniref:RidA family protein n=1 Tax=Bosea sp. (strain PAMC 26642) TaxID=1792307 RepID=UPI000770513F|nr:RidA family protein [Bosea sp. PAMC 26642]AMJ63645.1 reactive intermediate/imine deaminase [Bosea sp. PAMC 26642]